MAYVGSMDVDLYLLDGGSVLLSGLLKASLSSWLVVLSSSLHFTCSSRAIRRN